MVWAPGTRLPRFLLGGSAAVWYSAAVVELRRGDDWFAAGVYVAAAVLISVFAICGTPKRAAAYAAGIAGAWRISDLWVAFRQGLVNGRVSSTILVWSMFTILVVLLITLNWRIAPHALIYDND